MWRGGAGKKLVQNLTEFVKDHPSSMLPRQAKWDARSKGERSCVEKLNSLSR